MSFKFSVKSTILAVMLSFTTLSFPAHAQSRSYYTPLIASEFRQLPQNERQQIQQLLMYAGMYSGDIDGVWGPGTKQALVDGVYALEMQLQQQFDLTQISDVQELLTLFFNGQFEMYILGEGDECDGCEADYEPQSDFDENLSKLGDRVCNTGEQLAFHCAITGKDKEVSICAENSGNMRYSYGSPNTQAELELNAPAAQGFDGFYNYGAGGDIWHEATFTNGEYSYVVSFSVDRRSSEHPIRSGVLVSRNGSSVALLECSENTITNNLEILYPPR